VFVQVERRHVAVRVLDEGALVAQRPDDRNGRRLAPVGDVTLVGDAEDENPRAVDGLALAVDS
jgi:hypothetical protein